MLRLTVNFDGGQTARDALAWIAARGRDLSRPLGLLGTHLVRETVRDIRSGASGVQARHATSGLAGSLTHAADAGSLSIGSNKAYALYQQFGAPGGRQVPTRAKYLTIPIGENVGARGDAKISHARDVPDGFVWRSPTSGELFIASAGPRRPKVRGGRHRGQMAKLAERFEAAANRIRLWFLLRRSVPGRAHNFCRFDAGRDAPRWDRYVSDWLTKGK